jgi:hypothetical protein
MKLSRFALSLALIGTAAFAAEEVEVSAVRFTPNLRAASGANWYEADVALDVRPGPGAPGRMVSRVRVALVAEFELPGVAGGERRTESFRAEAECVALDAGRADVRFYLPPELVKRDQLHGDPRWWGVEVAVGGRPVPPGRASYSGNLATPDARKNFQTRAAAAAAANDGLLQPQFLTPFANDYPRATPSFVRREMR